MNALKNFVDEKLFLKKNSHMSFYGLLDENNDGYVSGKDIKKYLTKK